MAASSYWSHLSLQPRGHPQSFCWSGGRGCRELAGCCRGEEGCGTFRPDAFWNHPRGPALCRTSLEIGWLVSRRARRPGKPLPVEPPSLPMSMVFLREPKEGSEPG